jgi:hypothetical protein
MSTEWDLGIKGLSGDERSAKLCLELEVDICGRACEGEYACDVGCCADSITIARLDQDAVLELVKKLLHIVDCNVLESDSGEVVDIKEWLLNLSKTGVR